MFEYYSNATDKTLSGKYNLPEIDEENGRESSKLNGRESDRESSKENDIINGRESGGAVPDTIRPN